jgi:hypothetical protein
MVELVFINYYFMTLFLFLEQSIAGHIFNYFILAYFISYDKHFSKNLFIFNYFYLILIIDRYPDQISLNHFDHLHLGLHFIIRYYRC